MKITADFHTHTRYSHGTGSVTDNAVNALSLGMRAVAITDHAKNHPLVGVKPEKIDVIRADVNAVDKEYRNIRVLLGLEANLISPRGDIDVTEEQAQKLDILLVGFHLTAYQKKFCDYFRLPFNGVTHIFFKNSAKQIALNTAAVVNCVLNNRVDILTHPGFRIDVDYGEIAKACAHTGTYLEISSRHRTPDEKGIEKISTTEQPAELTISLSESTKGKESFLEIIFPTDVFPAPINPTITIGLFNFSLISINII